MHSRRTAAFLRAAVNPVIAGALVLLLAFVALASASEALHACVHADHGTPAHHCTITSWQHGHGEAPTVVTAAAPVVSEFPTSASLAESFFVSHETKLFPERGPPALS